MPSVRERRDLLNRLKAEEYVSAMELWRDHMSEYFRIEGPFEILDTQHPDLTDAERAVSEEEEEAAADDAG